MSQCDDYMRDLERVLWGEKPAVIIERRKSAGAYSKAMAVLASRSHVPALHVMLADSSGLKQRALIIGERCGHVWALLGQREIYTREEFQTVMGRLLGYSYEDCAEYVKSETARTCGCELCGGPTLRHNEAQIRRTMYVR